MHVTALVGGEAAAARGLAARPPEAATLVRFVTDDPDAPVHAAAEPVETLVHEPGDEAPAAFAESLLAATGDVDLVVVDGFEGPLPATFLHEGPPTVGLHDALLPAFHGPTPVESALEAGVTVTGATAYLLTVAGDAPVVSQVPVPVRAGDDVETLAERVRNRGRVPALLRAVRALAAGRVQVGEGGEDGEDVVRSGPGDAPGGDHGFPAVDLSTGGKVTDLRYGENPDQAAALYATDAGPPTGVVDAPQVNAGAKGMSYTNYLDAAAGLEVLAPFDRPAAALVKHATPAGVATADTLETAYRDALATDPMSAFGGVVALNRSCDVATARAVVDSVKHVVVAPGYEDGALEVLGERENMRVLDAADVGTGAGPDEQALVGGRLVQERPAHDLTRADLEVVTEQEPTDAQLETMLFAWHAVAGVRSNAIVFADDTETVGIGGGQVSRVDAVHLAARKAREHAEGKGPTGTVMASDGFLPFPDGVEVAAEAGVEAIVQPGGSINDDAVTERADELGLAMVHTGRRCFRHG